MTPERFRLIEELFHEALDLPPRERDAFINHRCNGDSNLVAAVRKLLAADAEDSPIAHARAEIGRVVNATLAGAGESPGDRIDRYVLKDAIGEGGFGVVYLAEQVAPVRRDVALKIIKLGMDTRQVISRFEAERQALAMMTHPGIATVLDAGATPTGRPYFVMELVRGEPITDFCDNARLSIHQRLELFLNVCDAVQHAHQKGVIHRDLKPSNVLVARGSSENTETPPLAKIIDFGIAKATSARLTDVTIHTEARQFVGTPEYMSPEQTGGPGTDIDTRSDIYSLGVVLYELLTGAVPFETSLLRSGSYVEMQRIIRESVPARPSSKVNALISPSRFKTIGDLRSTAAHQKRAAHLTDVLAGARRTTRSALRRQLQGDLDWIILKCLEKDRDRRYHTAHDLALDIRRYLADQPVAAGPPSVRYRLRKFARRHRGPLVAAGLVVAALVAGLSFATYGLVRARQQRNMAVMALEFVEEVIAAPDPNRGNRASITIVETLEFASKRLDDGDLGASVEAQARIRRMLGSTYMAMGLHEKAGPELDHALDLAQRAFGRNSEQAAMAWNDLGELNRFRGNFEKAEAAYNEAIRIQNSLPRGMATAQSFNNLGLLKQAQGNFDEALELQQKSLKMRLSLFGRSDPEVATSYNNLGALSMAMGDFAAAEDFYRHALEMRLTLLEPGHWRVASTQLNLARALIERGEVVEADTLATAALASNQRAFGETHTQVGRSLFCLGVIRRLQGKPEEAEKLLRASVDMQRVATAPGHPEIAHSLAGLGEFLIEQQRFDEAEKVLREALQIRRDKFNADHPLVAIASSLLGEALLREGNVDEAEPFLREGQQTLAANKHVAQSQRRKAAERMSALARARGDSADERRWTAEASVNNPAPH